MTSHWQCSWSPMSSDGDAWDSCYFRACWHSIQASLMAQRIKNPPAFLETQETRVQPLAREDPLEEEMSTHSSIFAEKSYGQRSLADYGQWGTKESDTTGWLSIPLSIRSAAHGPRSCFNVQVLLLKTCTSQSQWSESRLVVSNSVTPWTIKSMEFPKPEYWSG